MQIRTAEQQDIDQILILLKEVLEIHASIRPDIFNHGVTKHNWSIFEIVAIIATTRARFWDNKGEVFKTI